jgi:hypothetical protein
MLFRYIDNRVKTKNLVASFSHFVKLYEISRTCKKAIFVFTLMDSLHFMLLCSQGIFCCVMSVYHQYSEKIGKCHGWEKTKIPIGL